MWIELRNSSSKHDFARQRGKLSVAFGYDPKSATCVLLLTMVGVLVFLESTDVASVPKCQVA